MKEKTRFATWLKNAKAVAAAAHRKQRYGDFRYTEHLRRVYLVLQRFGVEPEPAPGTESAANRLLIAAWLHDILEDTPTPRSELTKAFGAAACGWGSHRIAS